MCVMAKPVGDSQSSKRKGFAADILVLAACLFLQTAGAFADAQNGGAAQRAVNEARKYAGATLTIEWQAGLQSLDPLNYSGPLWEKLTGVKIRVVEVPISEVFSKIMLEHRAGTGTFDVVDVVPAWTPDLVRQGALEPLDAYIDKFGYRDELSGIAPAFRDYMTVDGRIYSIFDDGDVLVLYYRKDIFSRLTLRKQFRDRFGYDLAPPSTWKQFSEVGSFLTETLKDDGIYGASMARDPSFAYYMFIERFRNEGGKFFDPVSMRAKINGPAGVRAFSGMAQENRFMPPGVEKLNFVDNLAIFLAGHSAMTISWPPVGRWAAGYGADDKAMSWIPKSRIAGKVGYALPPGGRPEIAIGHSLAVASASKNKELAYLFIQWLNSEEISTRRVQLPYTLRDPFRVSHFSDPGYLSAWPDAADYLSTLKLGSERGLIDLSLIQTDSYEEALREGLSRLWAGQDPQRILDDVSKRWNDITRRIGVDRQRQAYAEWMAKPGAYPR